MGLEIHLLGDPWVARDGVRAPAPRGRKAWGLLARLLSATGPLSRAQLASQLFEDAEDPLAALRWNLSELRRLLGGGLRGRDALMLDLPPDTVVDIHVLGGPSGPAAIGLPGLGRELLEGMPFDGLPGFSVWLDAERRRLSHCAEAVLREAALSLLAKGAAAEAAAHASHLLALDPLDESHHALLVRSLAAAGDGIAAARQVAACRELFLRELGAEPGLVLAAAAGTTTARPVAGPSHGRSAVQAQLEAGAAAIRAGAHDAGIHCLRLAVFEADALEDPALRARARVELGGALIHSVRGQDEEGAVALHEALAICQAARDSDVAAIAARELGYVEFLRGRYGRALHWLETSARRAGDNPAEQAAIRALRGAVHSDTAHYGPARDELDQAVRDASRAQANRQRVYAQSMLGRLLLLQGEFGEAAEVLDDTIGFASAHWTAFLPWAEALRAEVDLALGDVTDAARRFAHSFALASQLRDPCWECFALRGLGLIAVQRGEAGRAVELFADGIARSHRQPDTYVWARASALESLCDAALHARMPTAGPWVRELRGLAARCGMRELLRRAHAHAAALGVPGSAAAARHLAAEIDGAGALQEGPGNAKPRRRARL